MGVKLKNTSSEILSLTDGTLDITLEYLAATVNTLSVTVTGKVNFSIISGNARFYTNAAGTTGETNTWDATSGAVRTIYLKGASGDSVLRVSNVDRWTQWNAWEGTGLSVKALNLSSLPRVMTYIFITGSNTITGNLADAPAGLTSISIGGSNTITGNLADAPAGLISIYIIGSNTISGNLADAPAGLTYIVITGLNTITGNIADAPAGLTYIAITGSNTITGDIANAPDGLASITITGSNTITGNLSDAPAGLTYIYITGSNTISGNLGDAPAGLTVLIITGSNTITGNIADAPAGLTYLIITGSNTINQYTAGRAWATNYNYLFLRQAAGQGFDSTEVDNILIDLAAATWGGSSRTLDLGGVNAARTSASDAAVATLISKSVSVLTN